MTSARTRTSSRSGVVVPMVVVTLAVLLGAAATNADIVRVAIAIAGAITLVAIAAGQPVIGIFLLVVWLAVLGLLRRVTTGASGTYSLGDPLLLVGPLLIVTLAAVACRRGALRERTPLTNSVLVLIGVLALSIVNPLQGGITVGLAGGLLVVVPMLSFFVGRTLLDDRTLRRVLLLFAGLAVPAAGYGLVQTFVGFPSWDQRWINESGYAALNVGGALRAFGSFASGAEYATFVAIGIVCWLTLGARSRARLLTVPVVILLAIALWYESSRGIVVLLLAAVAMILGARAGWPLWRATALMLLGLALLPWAIGQVMPTQFGSTTGSVLAEHQVRGLADPFGPDSTLGGHLTIAARGVSSMFHQPVGYGVGSVTIARKFSAGDDHPNAVSSEVDPGNVATAAGIAGLLAYLLVAVLVLRRAYVQARRTRDPLHLAVLGVLVVTFLQWLNGGQYAVVIVPWMVMGWLDRPAWVKRASATRGEAVPSGTERGRS